MMRDSGKPVSETLGPDWCELYRCDDLGRVRAVATTLAAMEYEVRCAGSAGIWADTAEERPGEGPYVVHVRCDDAAELAGVLDEMIREQEEFDAMLAERALRGLQRERRMMVTLLIIVMSALGVLGLLRM